MNFELKALDLSGAASEKCDALIVLLHDAFKPEKDALSTLVAQTRKAGDLDPKPGKFLSIYRPSGAACKTAILAGIGDGSVQQVRKAITAAVGAVKRDKLKKLVICFASSPSEDAVRCAVTTVAEASYVYTTTKSKPEGRTIQRVVVCLSSAAKFENTFKHATAAAAGGPPRGRPRGAGRMRPRASLWRPTPRRRRKRRPSRLPPRPLPRRPSSFPRRPIQ